MRSSGIAHQLIKVHTVAINCLCTSLLEESLWKSNLLFGVGHGPKFLVILSLVKCRCRVAYKKRVMSQSGVGVSNNFKSMV